MERNPGLARARTALLAALLAPLLLAGCLGIEPKDLGQQGLFNFNSFNTNGSTTFKFNFALANTSNNTVYLQGETASQASMIGTCNYAGTGCYCTFYDSSGNNLGTNTSSQITYDDTGNYYRCVVPSGVAIGSVSAVAISNLNNSVTSGSITLSTLTTGQSNTLTVGQLIGPDLDENRVRYVYQYACLYNYLQKTGTTTQSFDCTNQSTDCATASNFCTLKATFPFYLYSDTYGSNVSTMPVDSLYNTTGTGLLCGLQIKQYDCVSPGAPAVDFGLYDQTSGIWQTSVNLPAGPNEVSSSYGYAATTSSVTGECPPGLTPLIFYTATIDTSTLSPSSNFPTGQVATQVAAPTTTPAAFNVVQYAGYNNGSSTVATNCNGSTCNGVPNVSVANAITQAYSSSGQTTFCGIPASLLP